MWSLQLLLKKYKNVAFRDGDSIDDFLMRINGFVAGLRELWEELEDGRVVWKIMHVIPKKLRQVGVAIEMLGDLDTMTMEELVGWLHVAEAADTKDVAYGVTADSIRFLLLTEE
jgi:hypothetical protein